MKERKMAQIESYIMLLDWKNQYCENNYTIQSLLQIQCNPYQITNSIFHRTRKKNFTVCLETQKTLNSQTNHEKGKQSWRNHTPWLQNILQSYSNQNSMVLAPKQTYRLMKKDRKPIYKPLLLCQLTNDKGRRIYRGEKTVSSISVLRKLSNCM